MHLNAFLWWKPTNIAHGRRQKNEGHWISFDLHGFFSYSFIVSSLFFSFILQFTMETEYTVLNFHFFPCSFIALCLCHILFPWFFSLVFYPKKKPTFYVFIIDTFNKYRWFFYCMSQTHQRKYNWSYSVFFSLDEIFLLVEYKYSQIIGKKCKKIIEWEKKIWGKTSFPSIQAGKWEKKEKKRWFGWFRYLAVLVYRLSKCPFKIQTPQ